MLAIQRKVGESFLIFAEDEKIEITVVRIKGEGVRLAISAPKHFKILRKELHDVVQQQSDKQ